MACKQETFTTSVGNALIKGAMRAIIASNITPAVEHVADAADRRRHEYKAPGWNAKLSFKTFKKLTDEGVLA